jgi:hypothetical protein
LQRRAVLPNFLQRLLRRFYRFIVTAAGQRLMIAFQAGGDYIAVMAMDLQHFVESCQHFFGYFSVEMPDAELGDDHLLIRNVLLTLRDMALGHIKIGLRVGHFISSSELHPWGCSGL